MTAAKIVTSEELDQRFDEGEDMTPYMKLETAHFPEHENEIRKVSGSIPQWVIEEMEWEAKHLAISRNAVMNVWLADKAKEARKQRMSA